MKLLIYATCLVVLMSPATIGATIETPETQKISASTATEAYSEHYVRGLLGVGVIALIISRKRHLVL